QRQGAEKQLDMLREYRQDYANRLNNAGQTGITASNYHNFTRFLATLDEAIVQQNSLMAHLDHNIDTSKQTWQAAQHRLHSYEALQERHRRQRVAVEHRREQRATDEMSSIIYHRRRTNGGLS